VASNFQAEPPEANHLMASIFIMGKRSSGGCTRSERDSRVSHLMAVTLAAGKLVVGAIHTVDLSWQELLWQRILWREHPSKVVHPVESALRAVQFMVVLFRAEHFIAKGHAIL